MGAQPHEASLHAARLTESCVFVRAVHARAWSHRGLFPAPRVHRSSAGWLVSASMRT